MLTMIEAVRALHALGASLGGGARRDGGPASVIGTSAVGRLGVGTPADLVVLDDRLDIARVLVAGEVRVAA